MMLRYSLEEYAAADIVENAVRKVLEKGYRTPDIASFGGKVVGTAEMGRLIAEEVREYEL